MEFRTFKIKDERDALEEIIVEHYEEIAHNKERIKLRPDWERYYDLDEQGLLLCCGMYDQEELMGYYISFVMPNLHYSDDLFAVCDIVFIYPEYRKGRLGLELFKFHEQQCKELGVSVMTMHVKTDNDFSPLMEHLEWNWAEKLFTKCIK
ncbi:GNAT domain protein [Vibrio phage 464E53-1]|nr:GNAT domain protein [Vibrio phage 464E53-1]